jgi:very-short-patch-repair endonuclease
MTRSIDNLPYLLDYRRALRKRLTPAEAFMWKLLQGHKLDDRKFRRQHSTGNYILDFYCHSEKLALELDGAGHFTEEGMQKDALRTAYLNACGITVLRFENKLVFERTDWVLEEIRKGFKKEGAT